MLVYWRFNFQFFNVSVLMSLNFELYLENDNSQSLCSFIYQLARVLKWSVLVSVTSLISIAVLLSVIVPSQMPNQWQARNRGTQQEYNPSPHVRESITVLDSGFHPVDSGFRVLDSGFQLSRFRIPKRAGFQIFFCFNAFLRISFSCSNLAVLKDVVRRHNNTKFVFFLDLQNKGKKCIRVP